MVGSFFYLMLFVDRLLRRWAHKTLRYFRSWLIYIVSFSYHKRVYEYIFVYIYIFLISIYIHISSYIYIIYIYILYSILCLYMGVAKNNGTPKSSISIGFSIIFTIHFGGPPLFLVQHPFGYAECKYICNMTKRDGKWIEQSAGPHQNIVEHPKTWPSFDFMAGQPLVSLNKAGY